MNFRKIFSVFLATVSIFFTSFSVVYAEEVSIFEQQEITLAYEMAKNPMSILNISNHNATCVSSANLKNVKQKHQKKNIRLKDEASERRK